MENKFYGIGVGPGNSELMTIMAVKTLEKIDILYVPQSKDGKESLAKRIANPYIKEYTEIKERYFPMNYNLEEKINSWDNVSKEIIADVQKGKNVGFITLGDPMFYSTYVYLFERVKDDIEVVTIPGISSFMNIASSNNFPLSMESESLAIISCTDDYDRIESALDNFESIVLMKVYKNYKKIIDMLIEKGLAEKSILVSNSSMEGESVYYDIHDVKSLNSISYFTTILVNKNFR